MQELLGLAAMTTIEWAVVVLATALSVGGLLLQPLGNAIGRWWLGEDPAVRRWRDAWSQRRRERREERTTRRERKRQRKVASDEAQR